MNFNISKSENHNLIEQVKYIGDLPLARFGHTINLVQKNKVILFGGATESQGKFTITNDVLCYDLNTRKWESLDPQGILPSPRAAHATTSVESMQLVVYGGALGGGNLAQEDLHLLDLRGGDDQCQWITVPVVGTTPGKRYGHTLVFCKPYLIVFGGNTGTEPTNDCWCLNVERSPFFWLRLDCKSEVPPQRVYHSASVCMTGHASGMMVIYGGRTTDQSALNDTWGLRRHRDGSWDWVKAPCKSPNISPIARYQHSSLFMGPFQLVIGGRTNVIGEALPLEIYDTETSEWYKFPMVQRSRHTCWIVDQYLQIHGGFESEKPNIPTDSLVKLDLHKLFQTQNHSRLIQYISSQYIKSNSSNNEQISNIYIYNKENNHQVPQQTQNSIGLTRPPLQQNNIQQQDNNNNTVDLDNSILNIKVQSQQSSMYQKDGQRNNSQKKQRMNTSQIPKNIRLSHEAVVALSLGTEQDPRGYIRKVNLDQLQEESKKLSVGCQDTSVTMPASQIHENLCNIFLNLLMKPKEHQNTQYNYEGKFPLKKDLIGKLCDEVLKVIEMQPNILQLRPPLKIFGNIHGQILDLMKFFDLYGVPNDQIGEGDIESYDYLFLGNYCDRGKNSLEVICLLFALKLRYPDQIHLLRGSHEDKRVNKVCGLGEECVTRLLGEDINEINSVFNKINKVFDNLPLAALVQDKLLCIHSGIGSTLQYIEDIDTMKRPFDFSELERDPQYAKNLQQAYDIIWSEPTANDQENTSNNVNVGRNYLGDGKIINYGQDRLKRFIHKNNLAFIIRSHECVTDGFEQNSLGNLITIFSCTNYLGKHKNNAAVLIIKKNCEILPKFISSNNNNINTWYPHEESLNNTITTHNNNNNNNNNNNPLRKNNNNNNKIQVGTLTNVEEEIKKRPTTPPKLKINKRI